MLDERDYTILNLVSNLVLIADHAKLAPACISCLAFKHFPATIGYSQEAIDIIPEHSDLWLKIRDWSLEKYNKYRSLTGISGEELERLYKEARAFRKEIERRGLMSKPVIEKLTIVLKEEGNFKNENTSINREGKMSFVRDPRWQKEFVSAMVALGIDFGADYIDTKTGLIAKPPYMQAGNLVPLVGGALLSWKPLRGKLESVGPILFAKGIWDVTRQYVLGKLTVPAAPANTVSTPEYVPLDTEEVPCPRVEERKSVVEILT